MLSARARTASMSGTTTWAIFCEAGPSPAGISDRSFSSFFMAAAKASFMVESFSASVSSAPHASFSETARLAAITEHSSAIYPLTAG